MDKKINPRKVRNVAFDLPVDYKAALDQMAERDGRTISGMARRLVMVAIDAFVREAGDLARKENA